MSRESLVLDLRQPRSQSEFLCDTRVCEVPGRHHVYTGLQVLQSPRRGKIAQRDTDHS